MFKKGRQTPKSNNFKKMFYFSMITVKFFVKCSSFKNVEKIRIVILFEPCWQKWSRFYSWKSISKNWTSLNGFKSQSKAVKPVGPSRGALSVKRSIGPPTGQALHIIERHRSFYILLLPMRKKINSIFA